MKDHDNVNSPSHYASGSIECFDAMKAMMTTEEIRGYLRGNSFKYRWRYRLKNGIEDLQKAEWYEKKLIELELNDAQKSYEEGFETLGKKDIEAGQSLLKEIEDLDEEDFEGRRKTRQEVIQKREEERKKEKAWYEEV